MALPKSLIAMRSARLRHCSFKSYLVETRRGLAQLSLEKKKAMEQLQCDALLALTLFIHCGVARFGASRGRDRADCFRRSP